MKELKNINKVKMLGMIMLVLIMITAIGITYSYYFVGIDGSSTTSKINIQAGELNSIVLRGLISELYLDVSVDDMSLKNLKSYYSTDTKEEKHNTSPVEYQIAELGIVGNITERNKCTGSIKVEMDTSPNSMGEALQAEDAYIYIKGSNVNEKLDLSSLKENNSKTYNIDFLITDKTPQYIEAYMELQNKETGQNYIAGKMLNVTITIDSFKCKGDSEAPTITKFYVNNENKQPKYTNNSNITAYLEWKDEDATEYCVTSEQGNCSWLEVSEKEKGDKKLQLSKTLVNTGSQTLYAYLKDEVGNESTPSNDTIIIDKDKPTIDTSKTKVDNITETTAEITVVASDTLSGVKEYCYGTSDTIDTKDFKCVNYNTNGNNIINLSELTSGAEYTYYIYVTDNAGNSTIENKIPITFTTVKKLASEVVIEQASSQMQDKPVENDTLRRFQGSSDTVKNNYICFGTNDKDTCTSTDGQSKYMYRIMGIDTQTNELKIIKKEALDTAYKWHSTTGITYTWNKVMLFKQLNGIGTGDSKYPSDIFLTNEDYVPNTYISYTNTKWLDVIKTHTWSFADVPSSSGGVDSSMTASTVLTNEKNLWTSGSNKGTVDAKIGLMYISDYYLAKGNDAKCYSSSDGCSTNNWLFINLNDSNPPKDYEWTMSRSSSTLAWVVANNGTVYHYSLDSARAVRPVFYLKSTIVLEGTGEIDDPYRIVSATPIIEKIETINDNKTSFTVKITAGDYATKYCYKLDTEQDYKCTNSSTNEFTNVNANTNYKISVYVENKNGLRSEVKVTFRTPIGNKLVEEQAGSQIQSTPVEGDTLRRFQGATSTVTNNCICFGTSDLNTCKTNQATYMYRILGIDTATNQLKIIKKEALDTTYKWHSTTGESYTWNNVMLFKQLNGQETGNSSYPNNIFLTNTTYVPDKFIVGNRGPKWVDAIETHTWGYGDITTSNDTATNILKAEQTAWASGPNNGTIEAKVGLMYLSDYCLAVSNDANCSSYGNTSILKASWIHITNNDTSAPGTPYASEWMMSRFNYFTAWAVSYGGNAWYPGFSDAYAVRPVFYLNSKVTLSGSGSKTDPFIITGLAS